MTPSLLILIAAQALLTAFNVAMLTVTNVVGYSLAPHALLSTLPVTATVLGAALATPLVARSHHAWGRKRAFLLGTAVGTAAMLLFYFAVLAASFWMMVAAALAAGFFMANGSLFRFAATELVGQAWQARAMSWVLVGGLLGSPLGAALARHSKELASVPFSAAYLFLAGLVCCVAALLGVIRFGGHGPEASPAGAGGAARPLGEIARQPAFIAAVGAGALGFGVMSLLMNASPIAIQRCGLDFSITTQVIQWHVVAMFLPGLFTGNLIFRFGSTRVMMAGVALSLACTAVGMLGTTQAHFLAALALLGVGWNFLYTGGSALLTTTYRPAEKNLAQGTMDRWVFLATALASFLSGGLATLAGWKILNLLAAGLLLPAGATLLWVRRERQEHPPQPGTPVEDRRSTALD